MGTYKLKEPKEIKKITHGFVIQTWDNEKKCWSKQEFVAGGSCEYEDQVGIPCDEPEDENGDEPYLPFEMVQP